MTYSRYSEQCDKCACNITNAEGEVKQLMDEAGIECSLEQEMISNQPCRFFQEVE